MKPDTDSRWLALVEQLQGQLGNALNSLGGKDSTGLHQQFYFYSALHLNRAVQGYATLRRLGQAKAAVLLVRPALEAMFRLQAVIQEPALICRIAYTEFVEEKKMTEAFPAISRQAALAELERQWESFKAAYHRKYPDHPLSENKLPLREIAETAKLLPVYDTQYRLYCKHTHAALRAATGGFDSVTGLDNRTVALCAMVGIEAMKSLGADAPESASLVQQFEMLDKETPDDEQSMAE